MMRGMGLLDRLFRRRAEPAPAEDDRGVDPTADTAPRPATRPPPGKADTLPPHADTLVVYALDGPGQSPDRRTPCMVVLDFDPVDVRKAFDAEATLRRQSVDDFRARLDDPGPLRDPNSRGRLQFVRRWLADHDPAWVGWRLEPAATAGGQPPD